MNDTVTAIDLSQLPLPEAIETLDFEALYSEFRTRFLSIWAEARVLDPSLPDYDVEWLESDPLAVVAEAWSYLRLLDRARVNDAFRALLAQYAKGSNLDAIAIDQGLQRKTIVPATETTSAIMESDGSLLSRYLYSFDRHSAGSPGLYLFRAFSAWPQSADKTIGLWDARVNGHAIHGRRGDTDVVIIGPFGRDPTEEETAAVRLEVTKYDAVPEAIATAVFAATRREYSKHFVLEVQGAGVSHEIIRQEAAVRISAAAQSRVMIGGEIPADLLSGAAYGENIINVRDLTPITIKPDPYVVPVLADLTIDIEVRP